MKCTNGYTIEVLRSAVGYYIGTFDPEEGPNCRISATYWKNETDAEEALASMNFSLYNGGEIKFCNKGRGCFSCVRTGLEKTISEVIQEMHEEWDASNGHAEAAAMEKAAIEGPDMGW